MVSSTSDPGGASRPRDSGGGPAAKAGTSALLSDIDALQAHIRTVFGRRPRKTAPLSMGMRRAAVLLPLVSTGSGPAFVLTRRTDQVEHHKGQISFPGGALDDGEDPLAGALRETEEEIGVPARDVEILGGLDDEEAAVSGFMVSPFVAALPYPARLRVSADEVHAVLVVSLRALLDPRNVRAELYRRPRGDSVVMYYYQAGPDVIWGFTGRIVARFLKAVFDVPLVEAGAAG